MKLKNEWSRDDQPYKQSIWTEKKKETNVSIKSKSSFKI